MELNIDARGKQCPLPVIEAKKAIEAMTEGGTITVTVDNEIAVQNVLKLAKQKGIDSEYECVNGEEYIIILKMNEVPIPSHKGQEVMGLKESNQEEMSLNEINKEVISLIEKSKEVNPKKRVVIITSNTMGSGDDTLGKTLMKGFIFALLKQDTLPDAMIFYNSGAFLVAEGSESLEDLKSLEDEGVEIITCGTCLDYYELADKRKVGSVTNMYAITEIMLNGDLIITP